MVKGTAGCRAFHRNYIVTEAMGIALFANALIAKQLLQSGPYFCAIKIGISDYRSSAASSVMNMKWRMRYAKNSQLRTHEPAAIFPDFRDDENSAGCR